jgi:Circularly permutated YpsA SLOG family
LRIERIVSGGQTGVDRAALDVAIALGIPHGGWCPLGRIAEDGQIPSCYRLEEHPSPKYSDRTKSNVIDSDATLVLYQADFEGGTLKTFRYAENIAKPCLKIRLSHAGRIQRVHEWIEKTNIRALNIAGPRASKEPEIYQRAFDYLMRVFG